jgi:hypothetical protein
MTRLHPLCLLMALTGLACGPAIDTDTSGGAAGNNTSSTTAAGGSGGGQASSSGSGGSPTGGMSGTSSSGGSTASTGSGGSGGDPGPCMEDPASAMTPEGTVGPAPSKCHCGDEVDTVLAMLAAASKLHHDSAGQSCDSAIAVPAAIPPATYYVPGSQPGVDFHTGDSQVGWKCLDVTKPALVHCKYSYTRGASPIATLHGAPVTATSPDDFEVAAEGDADGDGLPSAYSIVGNLGPDGEIVLQPMFVFQPQE